MQRFVWIDNLRVAMIILVVILHTAVTYSGLGGWYYKENEEVDLFSTLFFAFYLSFTQAYFMSLLFMISGYFTQRSLERKGSAKFISGRLKRLAIPLLIYIFIIHPIAVKFVYPDLSWSWYVGGIKEFSFVSWTGPLWFLEALLIFSFIYILVYKLILRSKLRVKFELSTFNVIFLILLITLCAFLVRLVCPIGSDFYNLQFGFFSAYVFMFGLGIVAYSSGLLEKINFRDGKKWLFISLGLGIPAWFLIMFLGGPIDGNMKFEGGLNWTAFFYALWESFFCVSFSLALIGIFKFKLNLSGAFQKFLSDHAFAVFVFHAPVLIGISILLKDLEMHPVAKFFMVFMIAVPMSFIVSWLIRRIPLLDKVFS